MIGALEQSNYPFLPSIQEEMDFSDLPELIAREEYRPVTMGLSQDERSKFEFPPTQKTLVIVGPEGGFSFLKRRN